MIYFLSGLISYLLAFTLYPIAQKLGFKWQILDKPTARKTHQKPTPRTGGIVFFVVFWALAFALALLKHKSLIAIQTLDFFNLNLLGKIFLPCSIIFILGLIDDKKGLSPYIRFIGQVFAAFLIVIFGLRIEVINIPGFGMLSFSYFPSLIITIFWVVLLINILNWLDGLNGLASGVGIIAFLAIIYTAFLPWVQAFSAALMGCLMVGILLAFLPFNFFKGSIFMGDAGSNFLGLMIALSSILGGSKLATSFLVLGLPILDGLWVISQRIKNHRNIFLADKSHFHHRLLRLGLNQRQAVISFWLISLTFGLLVLSASTQVKFFGLIILSAICLIFFTLLDIIERRK